MSATTARITRLRLGAFVVALVSASFSFALGLLATPAGAVAHAQIQGSGSTWAYNAVEQWIQDTTPNGLQVVYSGVGSAQGRVDYADKSVDFAVSDIGYQGKDPVTGASDTSNNRAYAYLPIVAGGTSFPYHLVVNGKQVTNLRLSGETIAKIFMNKITNWDDPEIQHDNNLPHPFPSLPITPVVHSEGSGDTAQLTTWFATDYSSIYGSKNFTEYWQQSGSQVAENGSDSVINYITSASANGSIGYDQYSYALGAHYPVVALLNKAGYYTLPDQYNVAVALTKAQINYNQSSPDYLLQKLNDVYVNPAPQTYPLSSYSYFIEPTAADDSKMTTAKRQTLADYLYYSICTGQQEMGPLGYSPLPVNLVEAGFKQIARLHTADKGVDLTQENVKTCHNPTFVAGHPTENYLAKIAPKPPACAHVGQGPCTGTAASSHTGNPGKNGKVPAAPANGHTSTPSGRTGTTPGGSPAGTVPSGTGTAAVLPNTTTTGNSAGTSPDVASNSFTNPGTGVGTGTTTAGQTPQGLQQSLPVGQGHTTQVVLGVLAGLLILGAIVLPPAILSRLNR